VFLIDEVDYKKYTEETPEIIAQTTVQIPEGENIINTMNIRQRWIYLILNKDTR